MYLSAWHLRDLVDSNGRRLTTTGAGVVDGARTAP
jgi:hypothetical protein